jgi:Carboxypeptidase regulatory-like domain
MKTIFSWLIAFGLLMPIALTAQNLILNPGFEGGPQDDAPPWGVGGWRGSVRATTDEHHSGRRALRLQGGGDEGGINSAVQVVPIDPTGRTKYHYSLWVKIPSATPATPKKARSRWMFSDGAGAGYVNPDVTSSDWFEITENRTSDPAQELIPPAGTQYFIFRVYGLNAFHDSLYLDDASLTGEPTGNPSYPGATGTVKDANGNPVAGAVVFIKDSAKAHEFATSSALTDSQGKFTVCTADAGSYFAVAWKAGYSLSTEAQITLQPGTLTAFNPTIAKGTGGANLAIKTVARSIAVGASTDGRLANNQFVPENVFDGNSASTRYWVPGSAEADRWIYVDLDPVGKGSFAIREFVFTWMGVGQMAIGWPGIGDVNPTAFSLEYTTGDPAATTEASWLSKVAYTTSGASPSTYNAPVVVRLATPVTARAVRFRVPAGGGGFGPTEIQVNSDTLGRSTLSGIVKDATTGSPIAGARVLVWNPAPISSDPDIYGSTAAVPFVVNEEPLNATPYDYPVSKNIEQAYTTDAQGRYSFEVDPGRPIRLSALVDSYGYWTATVTAPANGSAATQDISIGKIAVISGIVKNSSGQPVYNAVVQLGGPDSKYATLTDSKGSYSFIPGAGTYELYADGFGFAANTQSVTLTADTVKDIILASAPEIEGVHATFDANVTGWEIARYDTNWVAIGTAEAAVRDTTQNLTPGGSGSALVEDKVVLAADNSTELEVGYRVLQRAANARIAVQAGKAYNVYFHIKAENWVTKEHLDAVHYQIVWRNAAGTVIDRILSHPHWLYPQPYWYTANLGHPQGKDDSVTLARLSPPAGAATLDVRVGWVRNTSGQPNDDGVVPNPAGSLLYVDDLVVDAVASGSAPAPTIAVTRNGAKITITYTGTLESSADVAGGFTAVAGATSPLPVTPDQAQRFYRTK